MMVACDDMNSIIQDDLDKGEAIYPGKVDSLKAYPGIGRVWLYWNLSPDRRVVKTVITYNGGTKEKAVAAGEGARRDSVEITGLEEGIYSFSAYTVDKDGHRSIAVNALDATNSQTINVYGKVYVAALSARGISKSEMFAGGNLKVTWQDVLPDLLYSVVTYLDHRENANGVTTVDTIPNSEKTTDLPGLKRLKTFSVKSVFQVGLDTASFTAIYYPPVIAKKVLEDNNFTQLTDDAAQKIEKLTYPLSIATSFRDLYYFPNLKELDLTLGTEQLPTLTYNREYKNDQGVVTDLYSSTVGGGSWLNLASGYVSNDEVNIIKDLLASGQLTQIKYTRNSYPNLDAAFEPYGDKITWIPAEPLPDAIMIPNNLLVDYRVDNKDRGATVESAADESNVPPEIVAKFTGSELKNVYKVTVTALNSTIAFSLPDGVQFGMVPHGHFKFDIYIQPDNTEFENPNYGWITPFGISKYEGYKTIRLVRRTNLANFPEHTPFTPYSSTWDQHFGESELGTWKSVDWNLVPVPQEHIRVITIQFGADGVPWGLPSGKTLTYYIANLRFSK
jgi:hypothetical protein